MSAISIDGAPMLAPTLARVFPVDAAVVTTTAGNAAAGRRPASW